MVQLGGGLSKANVSSCPLVETLACPAARDDMSPSSCGNLCVDWTFVVSNLCKCNKSGACAFLLLCRVQLSPFGDENTTEAAEKSGDETAAGENAADTSKDSGVAGEEGAAGENAIDDTKEMTLDEYKREQEMKRSRASFNIRKPGEGGEEKAEWKKMFVLKKKITDEEGEEEEEEESEDEDEYMRRGRQRQVVDIEINFADQRRGRGGRGGRGMGRGGPGRGSFGGPRGPPREGGERPARGGYHRGGGGAGGGSAPSAGGEPPKQSAPKVDDWNDFPSLVAA